MINVRQLSQEDYTDQRFTFIEQEEGLRTQVYYDTATPAHPTIGIGFNLDDLGVRNSVYTALGLNDKNLPPDLSATEVQFVVDLDGIIASHPPEGDLRDKLNAKMQERAILYQQQDYIVQRDLFEYPPGQVGLNLMRTTLEALLLPSFETRVNKWLGLPPDRELPDSRERIALVSLAFNSRTGPRDLLGDNLKKAILSGNRAEAWFEIRYQSNKGNDTGLAKRRYLESQLFGLYNDPANIGIEEALNVYQMLQRHRSTIAVKEALFGCSFDGQSGTKVDTHLRTALQAAIEDYSSIFHLLPRENIDSLEASMNLAKPKVIEYIKSLHPNDSELESRLNKYFWFSSIYLNPSKPNDADRSSVLNAEEYEVGLHQNGTNDVLVGLDQTDTIYGGKANDILLGEGGSDSLYGGAGEDYILGGEGVDHIYGGRDNDILKGGEGDDLYFYSLGDGQDRIIDPDGGRIFYFSGMITENNRPRLVGDFYRVNVDAQEWKSADGNITFTWNSPAKLVFEGGGSIELGEDFVSGDFGINLIDVPQEVIRPRTLKGSALGDNVTADGTVSATVFGYQGDDAIAGSSGHDAIYGGYGRDWIEGGRGDDRIEGGPDSDFLLGAQGDDRLYADREEEMGTLIDAGESAAGINERGEVGDGNIGNDFIYGSNRWDALFGGVGHDLIVGGGGDDYLSGDGEILMAFDNWSIEVSRLANPDQYSFLGHDITWIEDGATGGDDTIYGGTGRDYILGHGGDDDLQGGEGDDLIWGHAGDDVVIGGAGNDELQGDAPEWQLAANLHGKDYMDGGDGDDWMWGYAGHDQMFGGRGNDNILGGDGDDQINGEEGNDRVFGDAGNDYVLGGAGDDWLQGDNRYVSLMYHGDDLIDGQEGNDTIFGEGGGDTLYGGSGNDLLIGGSSTTEDDGAVDILEGGEGHDIYYVGDGDVVYDSDGYAEIFFLGDRLEGGDAVAPPSPSPGTSPNTYKGKRGTYTRDGDTVTYVTTVGNTVVIKNVRPGAYGIQLKGKPELSWLEGLLGEKAPWALTPMHLRR